MTFHQMKLKNKLKIKGKLFLNKKVILDYWKNFILRVKNNIKYIKQIELIILRLDLNVLNFIIYLV